MYIRLKQNYFSFSDEIYIQNEVLVTSSPLSGILTNIFLNNIENEHILNSNTQFNNKRYVDDILLMFSRPEDKSADLIHFSILSVPHSLSLPK